MPPAAWALGAAARDSESAEGRWLDQRMQQLGDPEAVPLQRAVPALASAGAAFNSPALQAAATVLQRTPTAGALAVELVRCAELEAPRRGERRAHCWRASDDPRSRSWDDLVADTAGGRCVPLAAAGSGAGGGDTATTTRAAARLYDDPVISLTVTIFEERYRGALPEVPHPAVIGLLRQRWRDDEEGTGGVIGNGLGWQEEAARARSAVALAAFAVADARLHPDQRKRPKEAIWFLTERGSVTRTYSLRYRSEAALDIQGRTSATAAAKPLHHEHVHPRKELVAQLLAPNADVAAILTGEAAGVVTRPDAR